MYICMVDFSSSSFYFYFNMNGVFCFLPRFFTVCPAAAQAFPRFGSIKYIFLKDTGEMTDLPLCYSLQSTNTRSLHRKTTRLH